jgi:hypothetical protein
MLLGFFTIVLGVLLSRLDLVSDGGRLHFRLLRARVLAGQARLSAITALGR